MRSVRRPTPRKVGSGRAESQTSPSLPPGSRHPGLRSRTQLLSLSLPVTTVRASGQAHRVDPRSDPGSTPTHIDRVSSDTVHLGVLQPTPAPGPYPFLLPLPRLPSRD